MHTKYLILSGLIIVLLTTGCAIKPLGYFYVDPYAKPFPTKIDKTLNIFLMDEVKDNFVVKTVGTKEMHVMDFRYSIHKSMDMTFRKNFSVINSPDKKPDTGLTLVIYRMKPYWKRCGSSTKVSGYGEHTSAHTTTYTSAAFQFETSLFLDDKKINNADGIVYSEEQMSKIAHAHTVFKNGLLLTCESINKEIFKDEIVEKIASY